MFPDGDRTLVGDTTTFAQKQKIALARAVYQDVDIYLLDDCLSQIDPQHASNIMQVLSHLFTAR
jgi:ATP-binding cassette subfamily C (CFTR/MRP) protein 1